MRISTTSHGDSFCRTQNPQKTSKDLGNMGNPVFDTIRKHDCGKSQCLIDQLSINAPWSIAIWLVGKFCEIPLGWWHSQHMESHKSHVPNHQPGYVSLPEGTKHGSVNGSSPLSRSFAKSPWPPPRSLRGFPHFTAALGIPWENHGKTNRKPKGNGDKSQEQEWFHGMYSWLIAKLVETTRFSILL